MFKNLKTITLMAATMASSAAYATPTTYSGVTLPGGDASFADAVVSYSPGLDVGPNFDDASDALGTPDWNGSTGSTSLGKGGSLVLQFTDNSLTTSGDNTEDLWIFEIGAAVESFNVQISLDNISWLDLGDISGQPSGIDIDAVAGVVIGGFYSFVKLTDVLPNQSGYPYGEADIDAVAAISSAPPVVINVPEPGILALMCIGLAGLGFSRRKKA